MLRKFSHQEVIVFKLSDTDTLGVPVFQAPMHLLTYKIRKSKIIFPSL